MELVLLHIQVVQQSLPDQWANRARNIDEYGWDSKNILGIFSLVYSHTPQCDQYSLLI